MIQNMQTSQLHGEIVLSIVHGLVLTVVCTAIMPHFLAMFTKNKEVISLGIMYSNIAFAFSITVTVGIALEKIFQSMGKMKISMICMSVGFIANIMLDPLLIFGIGIFPRMGMAGAALLLSAVVLWKGSVQECHLCVFRCFVIWSSSFLPHCC